MATEKIKVRALVEGTLEVDMVILENRGRMERFAFYISPKGTVDAAVVETEIASSKKDAFVAAIAAREGTTIQNNPAWEDVKTDDGTEGDATADDGKNEGTRYNWATAGLLYEIV